MRPGWNRPRYLLISGMESLSFIIPRASLCCQAKPGSSRSVGATNEDGEVMAYLRLGSAQTRETIISPSYWRIDEGVSRLAFPSLPPLLGDTLRLPAGTSPSYPLGMSSPSFLTGQSATGGFRDFGLHVSNDAAVARGRGTTGLLEMARPWTGYLWRTSWRFANRQRWGVCLGPSSCLQTRSRKPGEPSSRRAVFPVPGGPGNRSSQAE